MGWSEMEGIADRTDFDLKAHAAASGQSPPIFDDAGGDPVGPFVLEPATWVAAPVPTGPLGAR